MKLVEVIRTDQTEAEVFDKAYAWVGEIGKVAVSCGDTPVSDIRVRCSAMPTRLLCLGSSCLNFPLVCKGLYCEPTFGA